MSASLAFIGFLVGALLADAPAQVGGERVTIRTHSGDFAGDGYGTSVSGADQSLLHQFDGSTNGGNLSQSVANAGDINHDGFDDLLIGTPHASSGGKVTLYSGATALLLDRFDGTTSNSSTGHSVAIMPDSTGNGKAEWLCGASRDYPGGLSEAGSCNIFGFHPYLSPSTYSLSASAGGTIDWELNYPFPSSTNLQGVLDLNGDATCSFDTSPGLPSNLIGRSFWIAVIANPVGLLPSHSSVAIPVTIAP